MRPRVELIYDLDCPNAQEARQALLKGFAEAGFDQLVYAGLFGLVAASAWNAWPKSRSATGSCPKCIQEGAGD